jgi:hypothetical protein
MISDDGAAGYGTVCLPCLLLSHVMLLSVQWMSTVIPAVPAVFRCQQHFQCVSCVALQVALHHSCVKGFAMHAEVSATSTSAELMGLERDDSRVAGACSCGG